MKTVKTNIKLSFPLKVGRIVRGFGLLCCTLQVALGPLSQASVLVRAVQVSEAQLQVQLQAKRGGNQSFVEFWRERNPAPEKVISLQSLFEDAQRTLLTEGPLKAKDKYLKITELATSADWKASEREMIFVSIIRLASFESDPLKRKQYYLSAANLDEDIQIDTQAFDPGIETEYKIFRVHYLSKSHAWRPRLPIDTEIYINGRRIKNTQKIRLSPGSKRITLVSNATLPHTLLTDYETLQKTNLKLQPILTGSCGQLEWKYSGEEKNDFVAILDKNCVEGPDGSKVASFNFPINTAPAKNAIYFPAMPPSESIFKKPFFWVVTGAVLVAAAIVIKNQSQSQAENSPAPTHEKGL